MIPLSNDKTETISFIEFIEFKGTTFPGKPICHLTS